MAATPVILEVGKRWVFACALDWPGWCRRGKGEEAALDTLAAYADRYAVVAGPGFGPGALRVVARVQGTGATDFGVPEARGEWDDEPLDGGEASRFASVLEASWRLFDDVVAGAPAELRKGPRGGGRDRDAIADHVRESERSYGRQVGLRIGAGTPWPEQRTQLVAALLAAKADTRWTTRYAFRRITWHVLDHAWEIEDRSS